MKSPLRRRRETREFEQMNREIGDAMIEGTLAAFEGLYTFPYDMAEVARALRKFWDENHERIEAEDAAAKDNA
jgi:hypothetical protein